MALVLADRVLETTTVAGTGNAALSGAQANYQPFSVIGDGSTTYYTIVDNTNNEWEVGVGTYVLTGNYISRDTVLSSSNGGALVYFGSGNKDIFLDLPSEKVLLTAGDVTGPASAVADNFAAFNMTTGKLIKDSGYNASTFATAAQGALADTAIQPGDLGTAAYLDAGSALGVATLDAGGKVPTSQIPQMGDLNYQGTWNATTNTPTLTSSAGTKGFYYVVSVAGSTNLNGITDWKVGDWAVFNGSVWEKIDNTDAVTSVNGYTGTVVLTASDVGAQPAGTYVTSVSATSPVTSTGGTTPTIAMPAATTSVSGYLTSTDWNTFNSKGGGDVVGPSSATDNAIARYDTTTGKLIQNSVVTIDDDGNMSGADSFKYSGTVPTGTITPGTMWFDAATETLNFQQNNITQQIGEETFIYGRASEAITDGQVIAVSGAYGTTGYVTFEPAPIGTTDPTHIIGLATENIAKNSFGRITAFGIVHGLSTSPGFADGDALWYDPTVVGGYTKTQPSAPNIKVQIGVVTKAAGGTNGSIQVKVFTGPTINDISNIQVTSATGGQLLTYNQTSGYWKNTSLTAGTAITVTPATGGGITIANSAPDQTVVLTGAGGAVVTGTYPNFTITTPSGTVTSVTGTAPISSTGGATPAISISQATTSTNGYLSSTDWNTFNNKGSGTVTSVTGTAPVVSSGGATPAISMAAATTSVSGYLTSTDWNTFNGKYSTGGALGTPSSGTLTNCTGYTYANLSGTVPTWNQNTTGTASNITAYTINQNVGTANDVQHNSIGVGTAASATAGQIRATGNITAFYSSDRCLKEDIKPITEALDKVNAIGGVEFDWTDDYIRDNGGADGYFLRKHDFGVIAQDVQAVFPLAVREREDGKLAVDYEKLVALAFAAIKELKAEVDSLKGK
jgi:hypothetical protein